MLETIISHMEQERAGIMVIQLIISAVLGSIIGLERDIHGRSAGLRTHLLVSMGATLFMIISRSVETGDQSRIAAQIVSGIGFLGAGAIMKEGVTVRGLTTASSLWIVAGIGMAIGGGHYELAFVTTLISFIALSFLNNFGKIFHRESYRTLSVTVPIDTEHHRVLDAVKIKDATTLTIDYDHDTTTSLCTLQISLRLLHKGTTDQIFTEILSNLHAADLEPTRVTWAK